MVFKQRHKSLKHTMNSEYKTARVGHSYFLFLGRSILRFQSCIKLATNNTSQQPSFVMSSFHVFQRLPPELRSQIWKLAMDPREISFVTNTRYHRQSRSPMAPRALVAPLLHACWESRMLMKKLYKKVVFGFTAANRFYIWVNYMISTRSSWIMFRSHICPFLIQIGSGVLICSVADILSFLAFSNITWASA